MRGFVGMNDGAARNPVPNDLGTIGFRNLTRKRQCGRNGEVNPALRAATGPG